MDVAAVAGPLLAAGALAMLVAAFAVALAARARTAHDGVPPSWAAWAPRIAYGYPVLFVLALVALGLSVSGRRT